MPYPFFSIIKKDATGKEYWENREDD